MIASASASARRNGRPPGSRDRHGRANRVDRQLKRTARWRSFCVATGARLKQLREERDIAASELAAAIDVATGSVLAWERGRSVPSISTLLAIATALGCTLADLLPEQTRLR